MSSRVVITDFNVINQVNDSTKKKNVYIERERMTFATFSVHILLILDAIKVPLNRISC